MIGTAFCVPTYPTMPHIITDYIVLLIQNFDPVLLNYRVRQHFMGDYFQILLRLLPGSAVGNRNVKKLTLAHIRDGRVAHAPQSIADGGALRIENGGLERNKDAGFHEALIIACTGDRHPGLRIHDSALRVPDFACHSQAKRPALPKALVTMKNLTYMLDDSIRQLASDFLSRIESADAPEGLEAVRVAAFGRKEGAFNAIAREMGKFAPDERKRIGM